MPVAVGGVGLRFLVAMIKMLVPYDYNVTRCRGIVAVAATDHTWAAVGCKLICTHVMSVGINAQNVGRSITKMTG